MSLSPPPSRPSTVYGPVRSWRFGASLGIDPIVERSTCSFNCVYCQLGAIQDVTARRRVFVPTDHVREDLRAVDWASVDVVTISGSGEPTLALNLAEIIAAIKEAAAAQAAPRPVHLLTNATLLHLPEVRAAVAGCDVIACKLDASSDAMLRRVNRPAEGVTLETIVEGTAALRREFTGRLTLQVMCMPLNRAEALGWADLIRRIAPDEVQLNTPRRPYPAGWYLASRGDHDSASCPFDKKALRVITREEAKAIERALHEATGVPVQSVYHEE